MVLPHRVFGTKNPGDKIPGFTEKCRGSFVSSFPFEDEASCGIYWTPTSVFWVAHINIGAYFFQSSWSEKGAIWSLDGLKSRLP